MKKGTAATPNPKKHIQKKALSFEETDVPKKDINAPAPVSVPKVRSLPCPLIPHGIHVESMWNPCCSTWNLPIPHGICFG